MSLIKGKDLAICSGMICLLVVGIFFAREARGVDYALAALLNAGFEISSYGQPSGWTPKQWDTKRPSIFQVATDQVHSGAASAKITSNAPNDARFTQMVSLEPQSWYVLDGWVKTIGVSGADVGANLSVVVGSDYPQRTNDIKGTSTWMRTTVTFNTGASTTATVEARLGFYGSTVTGTAYFDDIRIQKISPPLAGRHIALLLSPETAAFLPDAPTWLAKLDDAYEAMQDLVGQTPYRGDIITIKEVSYFPGGEMVSGNPILWQDIYIPEKLKSIAEHNDLSFGPVHELGHDFDFGNSVDSSRYYIGTRSGPIDPEQWANFKVTYVADELSKKYPTATFYQSSFGYAPIDQFSQKYFVEKFANAWIQSGKTDWPTMGGAYTGLLYTIRQQIGWDPFKRTFRDFISMNEAAPSTDLEKIELFANMLSKNSAVDVTPFFRKWGIPIYLSSTTNMCSVISKCEEQRQSCPDGFVARCIPLCQSSMGCGRCMPSCAGHEMSVSKNLESLPPSTYESIPISQEISKVPLTQQPAPQPLPKKIANVKGRILLQVQSAGEAWYVNPQTGERTLLGRPADAFATMRKQGIGVSNNDLKRLFGVVPSNQKELKVKDGALGQKLAGAIILQVERRGEAYYLDPTTMTAYFLGRPADAFAVMRNRGLGITNENLSAVPQASSPLK